MIEIVTELNAIHRRVSAGPGDESVGVLLRRRYDAAVEDVWDAVTDPERLARWFLPVKGELRVGGTFQLEGNAGGEILRCEAPRLLRVTFGAPTSIVELRLRQEPDGATALELEHTVPRDLAGGAGALYVGPGWDGALLGLGQYLRGEVADDPVAAANSREVQEFNRESIEAWVAEIGTAGTATEAEIAEAKDVALAQFAPDVIADDDPTP